LIGFAGATSQLTVAFVGFEDSLVGFPDSFSGLIEVSLGFALATECLAAPTAPS